MKFASITRERINDFEMTMGISIVQFIREVSALGYGKPYIKDKTGISLKVIEYIMKEHGIVKANVPSPAYVPAYCDRQRLAKAGYTTYQDYRNFMKLKRKFRLSFEDALKRFSTPTEYDRMRELGITGRQFDRVRARMKKGMSLEAACADYLNRPKTYKQQLIELGITCPDMLRRGEYAIHRGKSVKQAAEFVMAKYGKNAA